MPYKCVRCNKEFYDFENLWNHDCKEQVLTKLTNQKLYKHRVSNKLNRGDR